MKPKNIIQKLVIPIAVLAPNGANATEAQVTTLEQLADVILTNDKAAFSSKEKAEDWYHQKKLIQDGDATILIQPVQNNPGFCEVGLDGFPQKYAPPADVRTMDGKLEKAELILNGTNDTFLFPCDLKAENPKPVPPVVPPTPIVPEPSKEELPFLLFSPGASYLQIFTDEDETYGFDGNLRGGSLSLTVQPSFTNWYFGGRFSAYYGSGSNSVDFNVPATEGPLAGQLVMNGLNEYSLERFGIGVGSMFGYMIPFDKKGRWGLGLELEHGFMHDWVTREFTESSAQYLKSVGPNGETVYTILEGSNISNHEDNADTQWYGYATTGLRLKLGPVCLIPTGGIRTDLSNVYGMLSAGAAYCPNKG